MGTTRRWTAVIATAVLTATMTSGCGPSDEEILGDIEEICGRMIADLEELEPEPGLGLLSVVAGEAAHEFGAAAFQVEDVARAGRSDPLAIALHAVSDAYREVDRQLARREYESLTETRRSGEAAIAAAIAAAGDTGATGCLGLDLRAGYFAVAVEAAGEAAAAIAPTGDYVADVEAACARYEADVFPIMFEMNLEAALGATGIEPDAADYIDAVEDLLVIVIALETLVGELELIPPPTGEEAAHTDLVAGFRDAVEGFRSLSNGGPADPVVASAEWIDDAAGRLGVACGL